MTTTEQILLSLLTSLVSGGLVGLIFKFHFDRRLEQIRTLNTEKNIRFTKIFEKQAEVVATIYEKIVALLSLTKKYIEMPTQGEEKEKKMVSNRMIDTANDLIAYSEIKRIYLPQPIASKIVWIIAKAGLFSIVKAHSDFLKLTNEVHKLKRQTEGATEANETKPVKDEDIQSIENTAKQFHSDIPKLLAELEVDFQKMFGIHLDGK